MKEIWKQIKDFPQYQISNLGRVKGIKGKIKIPHKERFVKLESKNGATTKSIANLVYSAFIAPIGKRMQVYHKDGNPLNCSSDNLYSLADRDRQMVSQYNKTKDLTSLKNTYKLSSRTIRNALERQLIGIVKKEMVLPKHSVNGKMEYQNYSGENKIPFADNCTVRPKDHNHEAYLIRQFTYR